MSKLMHIFTGKKYGGQSHVIYGSTLCGKEPVDSRGDSFGQIMSELDADRSNAFPDGSQDEPELLPFDITRIECERCRELYEKQGEITDNDVWMCVDDVLEGRQGAARGGQPAPQRAA